MEDLAASEAILSAEEKTFFDANGYLLVKNVLSNERITHIRHALTRLRQGQESVPFKKVDLLADDDAFLDLIDIPTLFPKIWGILGPNIWVNHTHCNVIPTEDRNEKVYYGWHRDGGTTHFDVETPLPVLSLKTAFFLNDLDKPDTGQSHVIPGSHLYNHSDVGLGPFDLPPPEALALDIKAGSAVIFHPRLIHCLHSPNYSPTTREAVFVQWAYRWITSVDLMAVESLEPRVSDPIRRQLLGFTAREGYLQGDKKLPYTAQTLSSRFYPRVEDLPLRQHIEALQQQARGRVWGQKV